MDTSRQQVMEVVGKASSTRPNRQRIAQVWIGWWHVQFAKCVDVVFYKMLATLGWRFVFFPLMMGGSAGDMPNQRAFSGRASLQGVRNPL